MQTRKGGKQLSSQPTSLKWDFLTYFACRPLNPTVKLYWRLIHLPLFPGHMADASARLLQHVCQTSRWAAEQQRQLFTLDAPTRATLPSNHGCCRDEDDGQLPPAGSDGQLNPLPLHGLGGQRHCLQDDADDCYDNDKRNSPERHHVSGGGDWGLWDGNGARSLWHHHRHRPCSGNSKSTLQSPVCVDGNNDRDSEGGLDWRTIIRKTSMLSLCQGDLLPNGICVLIVVQNECILRNDTHQFHCMLFFSPS